MGPKRRGPPEASGCPTWGSGPRGGLRPQLAGAPRGRGAPHHRPMRPHRPNGFAPLSNNHWNRDGKPQFIPRMQTTWNRGISPHNNESSSNRNFQPNSTANFHYPRYPMNDYLYQSQRNMTFPWNGTPRPLLSLPPVPPVYGDPQQNADTTTKPLDKTISETIDRVKRKLKERKLSESHKEKDNLPSNSNTEESSNTEKPSNTEESSNTRVNEKKRIEHVKTSPKISVTKRILKKDEIKNFTTTSNIMKSDQQQKSQMFRKKILKQLFKLDKNNLQQLLSNPESSIKYGCALSSLIKDTRNSISKELRNVAEKSLQYHNISANCEQGEKIVQDAFLGHLETMLDKSASVELLNMEPQLVNELSKVLQQDLMGLASDEMCLESLRDVMHESIMEVRDEAYSDSYLNSICFDENMVKSIKKEIDNSTTENTCFDFMHSIKNEFENFSYKNQTEDTPLVSANSLTDQGSSDFEKRLLSIKIENNKIEVLKFPAMNSLQPVKEEPPSSQSDSSREDILRIFDIANKNYETRNNSNNKSRKRKRFDSLNESNKESTTDSSIVNNYVPENNFELKTDTSSPDFPVETINNQLNTKPISPIINCANFEQSTTSSYFKNDENYHNKTFLPSSSSSSLQSLNTKFNKNGYEKNVHYKTKEISEKAESVFATPKDDNRKLIESRSTCNTLNFFEPNFLPPSFSNSSQSWSNTTNEYSQHISQTIEKNNEDKTLLSKNDNRMLNELDSHVAENPNPRNTKEIRKKPESLLKSPKHREKLRESVFSQNNADFFSQNFLPPTFSNTIHNWNIIPCQIGLDKNKHIKPQEIKIESTSPIIKNENSYAAEESHSHDNTDSQDNLNTCTSKNLQSHPNKNLKTNDKIQLNLLNNNFSDKKSRKNNQNAGIENIKSYDCSVMYVCDKSSGSVAALSQLEKSKIPEEKDFKDENLKTSIKEKQTDFKPFPTEKNPQIDREKNKNSLCKSSTRNQGTQYIDFGKTNASTQIYASLISSKVKGVQTYKINMKDSHSQTAMQINEINSKFVREYKETINRSCQTSNLKNLIDKGVQVIIAPHKEISPVKLHSKVDIFSRMKIIDNEIQKLLQERGELYKSMESTSDEDTKFSLKIGSVLNMADCKSNVSSQLKKFSTDIRNSMQKLNNCSDSNKLTNNKVISRDHKKMVNSTQNKCKDKLKKHSSSESVSQKIANSNKSNKIDKSVETKNKTNTGDNKTIEQLDRRTKSLEINNQSSSVELKNNLSPDKRKIESFSSLKNQVNNIKCGKPKDTLHNKIVCKRKPSSFTKDSKHLKRTPLSTMLSELQDSDDEISNVKENTLISMKSGCDSPKDTLVSLRQKYNLKNCSVRLVPVNSEKLQTNLNRSENCETYRSPLLVDKNFTISLNDISNVEFENFADPDIPSMLENIRGNETTSLVENWDSHLFDNVTMSESVDVFMDEENAPEINIVVDSGEEKSSNDVEEIVIVETVPDDWEPGFKNPITLNDHTDSIMAIECIGNAFLAASLDGNVYYHCMYTGKLIRKFQCSDLAVTCLWVKDNELYTGSFDSNLKCYNLINGEELCNYNVGGAIQSMTSSWNIIFIGTKTGYVIQYDIKNKSLVPDSAIKFSDQTILALNAVKEGPRKVLLIASRSQDVTVKDAETGLLLRTFRGPNTTVYSLLLNSGKVFCGTSSCHIQAFDFVTGDLIKLYNGGNGAVCLKIHNGLLFAGCYDGFIYVFRIDDEKPFASIPGPGKMLLAMAILGDKIIAGCKDKSLCIWNIPQIVINEMNIKLVQ